MLKILQNIDRRWVFLSMLLAVAIPVLAKTVFPVNISPQTMMVFNAIEDLPEGSRILLSYDFDPASQGELLPMAQAFTRHCSIKGHKQYYMALWPLGPPMVDLSIDTIESEYPNLVYGEDYMKFDYKTGGEAVIRMITQDLRGMFELDSKGVSLDEIPMTKNIKNIQDMDLIINVSAGDPGTKQWVQFAATPFGITTVSGCTGVQAPQMYPYIPEQLAGVLGAIKAAAEYEAAIDEVYPSIASNPKAQEAKRRMGPQLVAHSLMIGLIILGNIIFFVSRKRGLA
ncbi:MAG TPA: hypothetical protein EYO01_01820 [Phycisphaerales bacterium]|nr:hypothetical protein [Phycisphaerales bacterium]HIB00589.1 hypothetical protein [Phycisphaerales bacterium]HIN84789.1 hypothetical protein [Phycisphaerales bacterium]